MGDRSDLPPSKIAHVDRLPPNKRNFTGLRFEVEQASRSLSAIAELLVCNAFLTHRLTEHDEILHNKGHLCVAGYLLFWWTFVHFIRITNCRQPADISDTFCGMVTKFGMVRGLANKHLLPKFGELCGLVFREQKILTADISVIFWSADWVS